MKDKKNFGLFIKEKRLEKNYSQKELADLLFVTESAVSKWERGVTYPDITLIADICRVLDVTEHELIESSHDGEYRKTKQDAASYNKLKKVLFWSLNITYITAILTCFIVNLAVDHTLSWFFIVLTSIVVAYTFCPTITWLYPKYKLLLFIGSSFVSLFLSFLTCSIYANDYWFMIATLGVLLGYFIIFYPILFTTQKKYLNGEGYKKLSKWFLLTYSVGGLILLILLLVSIYGYNSFNLGLGIIISGGIIMFPIIFGILNVNGVDQNIVKIVLFIILGITTVAFFISFGCSLYLKLNEVEKTHVIDKAYDKIDIDIATNDVNLYLSDLKENKICCKENNKVRFDIKVIDGVLIIRKIDERKFYEKMEFLSSGLDIYLSKDTIESLKIESSTSDISINKGFTFNNLKVINSTGDITIKDCNQLGEVEIDTGTGDVELLNVNCKKLDIEISTGDTDLRNVIVENDFNLNGTTGDVDFDGFDAANIYINLSTGSVSGTILTSKFFIAKSDTGHVNVPETREGGDCRITVSTGDIDISYKE